MTLISFVLHQCHALYITQAQFIPRLKRRGFLAYYCNKVREFRYWASEIPPGSVISAHDWLTEINMKDIQDIVDDCLEPYSQDRWTEMNARFATFRKPEK